MIVAGLVNLLIAAAKFVGGMISHSSAMMSEAAHSVADTVTEVLLFVALKRGNKPADDKHPFGYGRETYFWAFLASLATFVAGAGFSIYQGIPPSQRRARGPAADQLHRAGRLLRAGGDVAAQGGQAGARAAAAAAAPARSATWPRPRTPRSRRSPSRTAAALVGLVLAALGLLLEQLTGSTVWDGVASILIGVLLFVVASALARANASLLIGQAASPVLEKQLREELTELDLVVSVPFLLTSVIGPGQLVVAAKVDFVDEVERRRHREGRRRGRAPAGQPARGRALRLPRPDLRPHRARRGAHRPASRRAEPARNAGPLRAG